MLSRENSVILVFVVGAVATAVTIETRFTAIADWIPLAVLIGVGVIVPLIVNNYLDADEPA